MTPRLPAPPSRLPLQGLKMLRKLFGNRRSGHERLDEGGADLGEAMDTSFTGRPSGR